MAGAARKEPRRVAHEPDHLGSFRQPDPYVSNSLGIARWQLREALHQIKRRANLGGQDRVVIYDDGRVTDANGNDIGNILDEVTNE
jgi:hypothetical protein